MIELVGNDEVVFAQKGRNRSRVRRESRLENHAGLDVLEARDLLFQLHVDLHRARDGAHGARSNAVLYAWLKRRFAQFGMRREPEVIVRGKVDDSLAVEGTDRRLLVIKDAQLEMRALGLEFVELIGQERKRIGARGSGHGLPRIGSDLSVETRLAASSALINSWSETRVVQPPETGQAPSLQAERSYEARPFPQLAKFYSDILLFGLGCTSGAIFPVV